MSSEANVSYDLKRFAGIKRDYTSEEVESLKGSIKENTLKAFEAGCNLVLHCNGNYKEMKEVAINTPLISKFIIKKTSQFYKIIS